MAQLGRVFLDLLLGAGALGAWAAYRIQEQGATDEQRAADVIVVLGAAQYGGRPSPVLESLKRSP